MRHQEHANFVNLFTFLKERIDTTNTARKRAYRKCLNPDTDIEDYTQNVRNELQNQLHELSQMEYLIQAANDYLFGDVTHNELEEIIRAEKIKSLCIN